MKRKILKTLQFLAFLATGLLLFWLIYKDQDISRITGILKHDADYLWIWISLCLGLLSHLSRTLRWGLMIRPMGHKPRTINAFLAVMVGYLMNMVLPRMGEISRCGILSRYEKISFTRLVGTVVIERIIDLLMLMLLSLLVFFTQFGQILQFLKNNPDIRNKVCGVAFSPWFLVIPPFLGLLIFLYRHKLRQSGIYGRIRQTLAKFGEGLQTIRHMKNKKAFLGHTLFIWLMYYLMLYVVFQSFDFTSHLAPMAGLTTFVLGSYGMVAPVQGGIGAWHFMVIQTLFVYGISKADGAVFAFLAHTTMTAMYIVIGTLALLILPFLNRRNS
ncbi:MAG: lysylphosphatidylglycerol synthase transmembrane domain-containing protein [Mangrovibacterium sp.]